ncbi:MAG: hypothetical protein KAT66_00785 [Candidatus Lokiarchaeota archaeon]|nr:hypothetical protein [Candidatus Lokiarchaeota archaeon]
MGDKSFAVMLLATLGTVSSAVFSGANKHSYTLQDDNQHDSLSIHTDDPIGDLIFELAMIESLSISITPDELVKYTVSFKSKNSAGNTVSSSYSAENKFLGRYLTFKLASVTGDLDAASGISLKSLNITFTKNLELDNVLGTVQPEDILNKLFTISGDLELNYEDRTWANYMLDGSYRALRLDLVNTDVTIGTTNPAFRLDLSKVDFEGWEPSLTLDEICTQSISFTALFDLGGNGNVINDCYVVNEDASI